MVFLFHLVKFIYILFLSFLVIQYHSATHYSLHSGNTISMIIFNPLTLCSIAWIFGMQSWVAICRKITNKGLSFSLKKKTIEWDVYLWSNNPVGWYMMLPVILGGSCISWSVCRGGVICMEPCRWLTRVCLPAQWPLPWLTAPLCTPRTSCVQNPPMPPVPPPSPRSLPPRRPTRTPLSMCRRPLALSARTRPGYWWRALPPRRWQATQVNTQFLFCGVPLGSHG